MKTIKVSIGQSGVPGRYDVEILESPAGEASATVTIDADRLMEDRAGWQRAILLSSVETRRIVSEQETVVRDIGQKLFETVFSDPVVAARYRSSVDFAADRGEPLQVVLRISAPELAALPWEAMYDPHAGTYVCRVGDLVRYVPVASAPHPLQVQYPVRILGITASPRGLPLLDVAAEEEHLTRALDKQVSQGRVELHWIRNATWDTIHDTLLSEQWHVLHFIGHGDFNTEKDEGILALEGPNGRAHHVGASRFADLLHEANPMPRLLILNSCKSGQAGATDLFSGTASALVRGGVSAVVAMQFEITDPAAVAFARGFYSGISAGRPVDQAVRSGRVSILGLNDPTLEWITPVLYVRGQETRLFTLAKKRPRDGSGEPGGGVSPPLPSPIKRPPKLPEQPDPPKNSGPPGDGLEEERRAEASLRESYGKILAAQRQVRETALAVPELIRNKADKKTLEDAKTAVKQAYDDFIDEYHRLTLDADQSMWLELRGLRHVLEDMLQYAIVENVQGVESLKGPARGARQNLERTFRQRLGYEPLQKRKTLPFPYDKVQKGKSKKLSAGEAENAPVAAESLSAEEETALSLLLSDPEAGTRGVWAYPLHQQLTYRGLSEVQATVALNSLAGKGVIDYREIETRDDLEGSVRAAPAYKVTPYGFGLAKSLDRVLVRNSKYYYLLTVRGENEQAEPLLRDLREMPNVESQTRFIIKKEPGTSRIGIFSYEPIENSKVAKMTDEHGLDLIEFRQL